MTFDFDKIINRRGTNSYKWDSAADADILPLWVADMDFETAPAIADAIRRRANHALYGYTRVPEAYYDAVISWFDRRHGWQPQRDWIIYTTGVLPAIAAALRALTSPGDKVILQTPVYNCFFASVRNAQCRLVEAPLVYADRTYTIDFDDLERKASDPEVKVLILCNPHNPAGRVWTREELLHIGHICLRHHVTVISDEIHGEFVYPGHTYTPFASLSDELLRHSVTCISASKAFNIAGLQIANVICADAELRARIDRAINVHETCDVNPFGILATIAAYNESEEWLLAMLRYVYDNYLFMDSYCKRHLPGFPLAKLEGTYLAWMDTRALGISSKRLAAALKDEVKLWINAGTIYGDDGEGFMRWNLACPRATLADALDRFRSYAEAHGTTL